MSLYHSHKLLASLFQSRFFYEFLGENDPHEAATLDPRGMVYKV